MKNKIPDWSDEEFIQNFKNSTSMSDLISKWTQGNPGYYYKIFITESKRLGLTKKDFKKLIKRNQINIEDIINNKTKLNGNKIKKYLIKAGLLVDICSACGIKSDHNRELFDHPLVLQLDHIDGNNKNNNLNNLRILCPNCHSRTATFTGRKTRKYNKNFCPFCNKQIERTNKTCKEHMNLKHPHE